MIDAWTAAFDIALESQRILSEVVQPTSQLRCLSRSKFPSAHRRQFSDLLWLVEQRLPIRLVSRLLCMGKKHQTNEKISEWLRRTCDPSTQLFEKDDEKPHDNRIFAGPTDCAEHWPVIAGLPTITTRSAPHGADGERQVLRRKGEPFGWSWRPGEPVFTPVALREGWADRRVKDGSSSLSERYSAPVSRAVPFQPPPSRRCCR